MFHEEDMILPEGFDPTLGEENFTEDGELVDAAETQTREEELDQVEEGVPTGEETSSLAQELTTQEEEQPVETQTPQTLKVRYNHQDKELSIDEATVLAQKGMNYDRIEQRSRNQEAKLNRYEDMAKMFGFESAEAMMTQAEQNFVNVKVQELVNQGNSEAVAKFLVAQEMKEQNVAAMSPAQEETEPKEEAGGLSQETKNEIQEFSVAYPGVTKIPDEVFKMHMDGVKLKTAYAIWEKQNAITKAQAERDAALNELTILKQNQAAAAKGPVTGTVGKTVPGRQEAEDPFLKGFDSDY